MLDDIFVVNPVAHAYNLAPSNIRNRQGQDVANLLRGLHCGWQPRGIGMTEEEFFSDWSVDAMAHALFVEADVDIDATHTLTPIPFS